MERDITGRESKEQLQERQTWGRKGGAAGNSLGIGKSQERLEARRGGKGKERKGGRLGEAKARGGGAERPERTPGGSGWEGRKGRAGRSVGQEIRTNGSVPAPPHLGHQDIAGAATALGRPGAQTRRQARPSVFPVAVLSVFLSSCLPATPRS